MLLLLRVSPVIYRAATLHCLVLITHVINDFPLSQFIDNRHILGWEFFSISYEFSEVEPSTHFHHQYFLGIHCYCIQCCITIIIYIAEHECWYLQWLCHYANMTWRRCVESWLSPAVIYITDPASLVETWAIIPFSQVSATQ